MDERTLERALAIHEAAYRLLKWLGTAIERGFVTARTAHRHVSEAASAGAWIAEHFENIPPDCRPASRAADDLRGFANYFASYLRCSFEFNPQPHVPVPAHCECGFCGYIVAARHLTPARTSGTDRRRADERKRATLERLASQGGVVLAGTASAALLKDDVLRPQLATLAYVEQLVERCEGRGADRSALALWRQLAWQGHAPKRGFRLTVGAIRESEARVREAVATLGGRACSGTC